MIVWLVCRNRHSTKDRLQKWGIANNLGCVLCGLVMKIGIISFLVATFPSRFGSMSFINVAILSSVVGAGVMFCNLLYLLSRGRS